MDTWTLGRWTPLAAAFGILIGLGTSCAYKCDEIKEAYTRTLTTEARPTLGPVKGDGPMHVGVAVKMALLNQAAAYSLEQAMQEALKFTDQLAVSSSQAVALDLTGALTAIEVEASDDCPECVRIKGTLGGRVGVKLPVIGRKELALKGALDLAVPLQLSVAKGAAAQIKLDPKRLIELNRSTVTLDLGKLPGPWAERLQKPLSDAILKALGDRLAPVTLAEIEAPDLGLKGATLLPSRLETRPADEAMFIGFVSNLGPRDGKAGPGLSVSTAIREGSNLAVSLDPSILLPVLGASIEQGLVSRAYDLEGNESKTGPLFMTLASFSTDASGGTQNPFSMGVRLWHLDDAAPCLWTEVSLGGQLQLDKGRVKLGVDKVELLDSSMPDAVVPAANWGSAKFLEASEQTFQLSLNPEVIAVPGAKLSVRYDALETRKDAVVLHARAGMKKVSKGAPSQIK